MSAACRAVWFFPRSKDLAGKPVFLTQTVVCPFASLAPPIHRSSGTRLLFVRRLLFPLYVGQKVLWNRCSLIRRVLQALLSFCATRMGEAGGFL